MGTMSTWISYADGVVRVVTFPARHPVRTASLAAGLVKGTAEFGYEVARDALDRGREAAVAPEAPGSPPPAPPSPPVTAPPSDPRDDLPGPDLVAPDLPRPEDLPPPVVIEPEAQPPGEEFHTEPKPSSRASGHGGPPGDREEVEHYAEEAVLPGDPDPDAGRA